ncbi:MAG: 6-pyruvoyl trahydropterin synthase family protein [Pseudonocardiaceae bacterium]
MLTTLEMARAEFGFYAAHIALYNGEVEPLHGHTFQVTLRVSGEPDTSGMVVEFSEIKPARRDAAAPLRRRTLVPGQGPGCGSRPSTTPCRSPAAASSTCCPSRT